MHSKARPRSRVDGKPVNIPEPLTSAVGGRSRVGETADGCAVELTIARRFGKSGRHQGKGREEGRGKTRKKCRTPPAKKFFFRQSPGRDGTANRNRKVGGDSKGAGRNPGPGI